MSHLINELMNRPHFKEVHDKTIQLILKDDQINAFIQSHATELSPDMIMNSLSKLNEYRLEMKALSEGKEGKNPGFTPQLFVNFNYIDVTYVPTPAYLQLQAQRKLASLIDNRMMSADVRHATLKHFDPSTMERKVLLNEVILFANELSVNQHTAQGLFITGPFGTGKTFLMGALANLLAEKGNTVTMIHYPTFATEVRNNMNQALERINPLKRVDVLIIDDIGAESNNAWLRDDLLGVLLEYRMKESLPTFFTSNFNMAELESHLAATKDSNDITKAKRLMERIRYLAKEIPLNGENRRQKKR